MSEAQALYFPLICSVLNTEGTAPGMEAGRKAHCKLQSTFSQDLLRFTYWLLCLSLLPQLEEGKQGRWNLISFLKGYRELFLLFVEHI